MAQAKPDFRAPFFRDLYKTLLTVSGGTAVATVTFAQHLKPTIEAKGEFYLGFSFLAISIVLQLLIPFLNVIGAGFYWDGEKNQTEEDSRRAHQWGKFAGALIMLSLFLTIVSIGLLGTFVGQNI